MRNLFKCALAIGMLTGCALGAVSCSDNDDDDNPGKEQQGKDVTAEMVAQQNAVESVLLNLAGVEPQDTTGIDFEGQRYEPVIGKVRDESQPSERSVLADDEIEASQNFCALVRNNDFVKETTDGFVIDLTDLNYRLDGRKQKLGKLIYHRATDGSCLGYADVDIACVPQLQRITYLTKEQWGSNGGWDRDNYGWESPCLFGQVWYNRIENLYYVCVTESQSNTEVGWLINVQAGRGSEYEVLESNEGDMGAWKPKHAASCGAIQNYVKLCMDGKYYDMKQALRKRYPNEIFPPVPIVHGKGDCIWKDNRNQHEDGDDGFGTTVKGFAHWVGNKSDYPNYSWNNANGNEVLIIQNAWEGSWSLDWLRHWRNQQVYCLRPRARYDSDRHWWTKSYIYTLIKDCDYGDWIANKFVYTANGYSFTTNPPAGFGSEPVFDPATEAF